jgi:DNA-binding beta-propeller fold protein YncE
MGETGTGDAPSDPNRITREGLVVEFRAQRADGRPDALVAGDWADLSFRITDEDSGTPITNTYPAAWLDLAEAWEAKGQRYMGCKDRVATYMRGIVGVLPMIDLNSHFLLVLNKDPSISVIDPTVGITGITNLFAQINLKQPGADWTKTKNEKRLFVTMPKAGEVAGIDAETFKVMATVDAGRQPTRIELQEDERYLWVGNNAPEGGKGGVTVIDRARFERVTFIPTGGGHHEIAFSDGDRYAFVSNRGEGTVSVIDVAELAKVKDLATGPLPISLAFSPLSKALYVADGTKGTVAVVDGASLEIVQQIEVRPGLGPLRISADGRWVVVVNPIDDAAYVIDASTNRLAHTIPMRDQPYQVHFTSAFLYVRMLASADLGLIPVAELGKPANPPITYVPAGQVPPGAVSEVSIADSMVPSVKHDASYILNHGEGSIHYYMEGMVSPMGSYKNRGHEAMAIELIDRSLQEREPGVYVGKARIPVEGNYDVAFLMDAPEFVHCFQLPVAPDPAKVAGGPPEIEYQVADRWVPVGSSATVRFKLTDPGSGAPRSDVRDATVLYYGADGRGRTTVPVRALGEGLYEADVRIDRMTTYYVYVGSQSAKLDYGDLPFLSLIGTPKPAAPGKAKGSAGGQ